MNFSGTIPLEYEGKTVRIRAKLVHAWGGPYANWPAISYHHYIAYEGKLSEKLGNEPAENKNEQNHVSWKRLISVTKVEGDFAEVDFNGTGEFIPCVEGLILGKDSVIKTGPGTKVHLNFGGGRARVIVKEGSTFLIKEYLIWRKKLLTKTDLYQGLLDVKVNPKLEVVDFSVSTPTSTASVRGTHFLISYNRSANITTLVVLDGEVLMKCSNTEKTIHTAQLAMCTGCTKCVGSCLKVKNLTQEKMDKIKRECSLCYKSIQLTKDPADDIHPDWSPDGKIVFSSNRSGNYDIYVMNFDGSGVKQLTNDPMDEVFPSWSNDGKKIVYVKGYFYGGNWFWQNDVNNGEIWMMNADGSNKQKITDGVASPVFNPSDNEIAFVSGNILRIYKYNLNTHSLTNITPKFYLKYGGGIFRLSWFGDKIAYDGYPFGIQVFGSNGGNYKQVYKTDDGPVNPDWSPDGSKIAYSNNTWRNGYVNNIEIIDLATKKVTVLENTSSIDSWPSWSPDGKKIAFVSNRNGNNDIWMFEIGSIGEGNATKPITKVSNLTGYITTDKQGNLYVAQYSKGRIIKIEKNGDEFVYVTGIDRPRFPVFDDEGNAYVGSFNGNIYKISPDKKKRIVARAIWSPQGMGFDLEGNLYVAGGYDGNIYRIKGYSKEVVASGFNFPTHLAVDAYGNVYVVENKGRQIIKVSSGNKAIFANFSEQINGMAIDENGCLYVSHSDKISKVTVSGEVVTVVNNLNHPSYLAIYKNNLFANTREGIIKITLSEDAENNLEG